MSVEPLKVGKKFFKVEDNKNYVPKKKIKENDKGKKHIYNEYVVKNGNIDVDIFMDKLLSKLSSSGLTKSYSDDIYGDKVKPVEVDIKKEIYINKLDDNQMQVDSVVEGKVNNKLEKLRKLRSRNGS